MAVKGNVAAGARQCAIEHFHQFGSPRAHQARDAKDLALAQSKGDVIHARPAKVIHLQADFSRRFLQMRILIFELTSHHHFNQGIFGQGCHFALGNKLPVAKDGDVVADLEDLFHAV
ncbi:Uncharacterised protein [Enterobacter kobei]|nr:Uncharacterised protein [Enterobacter kobei]